MGAGINSSNSNNNNDTGMTNYHVDRIDEAGRVDEINNNINIVCYLW